MKSLYKMDSKGKIREWNIKTGKDANTPYYVVTHGVQNGAMQESKVYVPDGKNIGRMNETTPEEQCEQEAQALWIKQRDRKGYTEKVPKSKPFRPMLAQSWSKHANKIKFPAFISPKLDGIRCMALVRNHEVKLLSRQGKEFPFLNHIKKSLSVLEDVVLDGELYLHGMDFQTTASIVRKSKTVHPDESKLQFHVFDLVSNEDFSKRYEKYKAICEKLPLHIVSVPQAKVTTLNMINQLHAEYLQRCYEGSMLRNLTGGYQLNQRSYDLQKKKDFIDEEYEIVGYKTGKGKFADIPTFELKTVEGYNFEATPKGSAEKRSQYLADAESLIGKFATVRYFEKTSSEESVPRFPVLITIRDYE